MRKSIFFTAVAATFDSCSAKIRHFSPLVCAERLRGHEKVKILFKLENLQKSGSFKDRGIRQLIRTLIDEGDVRRLLSSSGGNAGHSVATIGKEYGLPVDVFVPTTTMPMMAEKIRKQGAKVIVAGSNWNEADAHCKEALAKDIYARYIPPFDDPRIWEGHSTMVDEIKDQLEGVVPDLVVVSVGGGGLLCGVQIGLNRVRWSNVKVLGVETEGAASFAAAKAAGKVVSLSSINTIASTLGALAVTPATLTLNPHIETLSAVVSDRQAVLGAVRFAEEFRQLVEPACGAALSVVYDEELLKKHTEGCRNVVVIVCGGSAVSMELLLQWKRDFKIDQ